MADPRDIPLPIRWTTTTPDDASLLEVTEQRLFVRCGEHLVALERDSGKPAWTAALGEHSGRGTFVLAAGDVIVTDTRRGPKRTTELVGVREGKVLYQTAMECLISGRASCVVDDEVYVVGLALPSGTALRSLRARDGVRRVDRAVRGARDVLALGERLLVLSSTNEPGLVTLDREGDDARVVEPTSVQNVAVAGGRLLAAVITGDVPDRTATLREPATGEVRWRVPTHGSLIALDSELALHIEAHGGVLVPVARAATTGDVRWRGAPLADDGGWFYFAGSLIAFCHGGGTTLYRRADGTIFAELLAVDALGARGRELWLAGSERLVCADAT
jgi:hypothetical protein